MPHTAVARLVVQLVVGRYLGISPVDVRLRHRLAADFGLDAFDIALVAVALGDRLGIEIPLEHFDSHATIETLVREVARVIEGARLSPLTRDATAPAAQR